MVRTLAGGSGKAIGEARLHIPEPRTADWPSVGVVIVTSRGRPNLVRRALASVSDQEYPGPVRVIIVFDACEPEWELTRGGQRPVLVLENWRTVGAAGARNTGVLAAADCELVAFCADDDVWAPEKLNAQVAAMKARSGADFVTCAWEVEYDGHRQARRAGRTELRLADLTCREGRAFPASGFLARQVVLATDAGRGGIGLLAERGPQVGGEWDLLLRAARRGPIVHVDTPLVRVLWRPVEPDPTRCADQAHALTWMVDRHPELAQVPSVRARLCADIACWAAGAGAPGAARHWSRAALRTRWWQPAAVLAWAAAVGVLRGRALRSVLRRRLR